MKKLLIVLAAICMVSTASAQILAVRLKDGKTEKKFKKYLTMVDGRYVILGEPYEGWNIKGQTIGVQSASKPVSLFVVDPGDPARVPYRIKKGIKTPKSKKSVVVLTKDHVNFNSKDYATFFSNEQSLAGLSAEYLLNRERIKEFEEERDTHEVGSAEWINQQRRLIEARRRMEGWLEQHGFRRAAKKEGKPIAAEVRKLKEDAVEARATSALKSIRQIGVPKDLVAASQKVTGGKVKFHAFESRHVRVFAPRELPAATIKQAMASTQKVIEGFRREFVDPYITEESPDTIPDEVFAVFLWVPDNIQYYENFYTEFLGGTWGQFKARQLQSGGMSSRHLRGVSHNYYNKMRGSDYECMMVNSVAHALADLQYANNATRGAMPWLREGLAYYLCFEFLGRNTVTWMEFRASKYDFDPGPEGEKDLESGGQRALYNLMAIKKGAPLSDLAQKTLHKMNEWDFAKSWSFFDYLARKQRGKMTQLLRDGSEFYGRKSGMLTAWRESISGLFGVEEGKDSVKYLDSLWEAYAKGEQKNMK